MFIKISVVVVLLAAAGGLYFSRSGGKPAMPDTLTYVCVETGKIYNLDRGVARVTPATNPDTGRDTLMPCYRGEDGNYYVRKRSSESLGALTAANLNHHVDPKSLRVNEAP